MEERSRLTLEGYNRMLEAEEATNSVRHEMRHHMIALMGILKEGQKVQACEYISSIMCTLGELPVFRYSENILVNVIAGEYLDRAKKLGVEVEHSLSVPAELKIADEDLSVFLSNMLENALEACERMKPGQERYIHVKMHVNENFLLNMLVKVFADRDGISGGKAYLAPVRTYKRLRGEMLFQLLQSACAGFFCPVCLRFVEGDSRKRVASNGYMT